MEVIPNKDDAPFAFRALLRWCIIYPVGETVSSTTASVQDMTSKIVASHYFAMETEVKDVGIKQMLYRMYTADLNDHCPSKKGEDITEMSVEDRSFIY